MSYNARILIISIIIFLLTNLSCNSKGSRNLHNSTYDNSVKDTKIIINYTSIPSGTCSKYKIISSLDKNFVNKYLKLIDIENQFLLDKDLQKICAFNKVILPNLESTKKIARTGSNAYFVLDGHIVSNVVTASETPSIVNIKQSGLQKFIPLDANSENFSIWVQYNINEKFELLNSTEKINLIGNEVFLQIKKIPENEFSSFYFTVPQSFDYGNYNLIFQLKEASNVELVLPIQIVKKDGILGSPEIKYIEVFLLKTPNTPSNSKIKISTCMDYSVIATDLNGKKYNITTKKDAYTTSFSPEKSGFSVNTQTGKICAFDDDVNNNNGKFYPSENDKVKFNVKYKKESTEDIKNSMSLIAFSKKDKIKFITKIESIKIYLPNNNSIIPINSCIDYNVVTVDTNGNETNITNKNSYMTSFYPEQSYFSMSHAKRKICAFQENELVQVIDKESKVVTPTFQVFEKLPEQNKIVEFKVKYKDSNTNNELIDTVFLVTTAEPEFIMNQSNPLSEENLTAYAGFETKFFKINLIKTLDRSQTMFAANAEEFEVLDAENKPIKLNSLHNTNFFNFVMPKYSRNNYMFTLRMKNYPSITANFSVTVK